MKKILFPTFTILLATVFISLVPTDAEGAIYEDTVRLHILARSDSEEDQAIKLALRDEILREFGKELSAFESVSEATEELSGRLDEIRLFADSALSLMGCDEKASVTLMREWYDRRDYESFSLPAGYYTSLKIVIGEGEGKNWWCVMFPPLCLDTATSDIKYSKEEEILISKKYTVKFKLLELISEIAR